MMTSPGKVLGLAGITVALLLAGCGSSTSTKSTASAAGAGNANAADKAFIAEIIPNDQLAVAMAKLAETKAQRHELKVFSSRIVAADTAQLSGLGAIAKALGVTPKPMKPAVMTGMENDAAALGIQMYQMGMDEIDPSTLAAAKPFDKTFLTMMAYDLGGAVNLSRGELSKGTNSQLRPVASMVVTDAGTGASQLKKWQSMWYGKGSHSGMSGMKGMKGTGGMKGMKGMSKGSRTGTGTTTTGMSGMGTTATSSGG
jgi:uncharacterized protein (DUF305 family)